MQVRGLTADEEEEKGEKRKEEGEGGRKKTRRREKQKAEREGRKEGTEVVCRGGQKARNTHSALLTLFPPASCPMLKESERLVTSPLALALSLSLTWGVGRETIARPTLSLFIRPTSQHIPSRTGSNAMEKDHHIHVGETTAQRRGCKV